MQPMKSVILVALTFALAACGGTEDVAKPENGSGAAVTTTAPSARAASPSTRRMRPAATFERTVAPYQTPGTSRSSR